MKTTTDSAAIALASYLQSQAALAGGTPTQDRPLLPWAVARYVAGGEAAPGLLDVLRADLSLYRFYRDLLATRAQGLSARQAAAAGEAPSPERAGQGFRLEFRSSRASPSQVFATIVLEGVDSVERGLQVHVLAPDTLLRLDFPAPIDGRSQRLFAADSAELALLRRSDSELVLVTL